MLLTYVDQVLSSVCVFSRVYLQAFCAKCVTMLSCDWDTCALVSHRRWCGRSREISQRWQTAAILTCTWDYSIKKCSCILSYKHRWRCCIPQLIPPLTLSVSLSVCLSLSVVLQVIANTAAKSVPFSFWIFSVHDVLELLCCGVSLTWLIHKKWN